MSFIQWTDEMSVSSSDLDGHHRMIIDCLNRLHPLLETGASDGEVAEVMASLEDFVLVHFAEEERVMKQAGYPDWRAHKDLHDKMYDVVFELKSGIQRGKSLNARQLFELLNDWLITHILGEDRKYVPYLMREDVSPVAQWRRSNGKEY